MTSSYDHTHVLSAVLGYDLGRGFRAGARFFWYSGRPEYVFRPGAGFEEVRLPSFERLDVRIEKRWTFTSGAWLATTVEWFNATLSREPDHFEPSPAGLVVVRRSALTLPSVGIEGGY